MDRLTRAPGTDADALLALLGGCNSETDGVELAYQALELVVARHHLAEAYLVLRPGSMAPQIFVHGRRHVTPDLAGDLARRPSGLYAGTDEVPLAVQDALTGCCEMALAAHAARQQAGRSPGDLATRPAIESAVRRAASRSARFRWRSTLVLLGTLGPGSPEARWEALAAAVRSARRICDEAGAAGPGRAAAILADTGPEDVDTYVARLRDELAGGPASGLQLVAGAASAPTDSVDPVQLWRLCEQRLADATRALAGDEPGSAPHQPVASEIELELRRLPDVVSVGMTGLTGPEARLQSVTVVARRRNDALRRQAAVLAAEQLGDVPLAVLDGGATSTAPALEPAARPDDGPDPVSTNGSSQARELGGPGTVGSDAPAAGTGRPAWSPVRGERRADPGISGPELAAPRVVLLMSGFDRSAGASEVTVTWRGVTAVGRAVGSPLSGAAQATLTAVEALGADIPYYLTSVDRASSEPGSPVLVALAARPDSGAAAVDRRFGVAQGADEIAAASRATLAALNRFLSTSVGAP